ncbi:hypothetical protein RHSIM_Rhsim01G0166400 [Rhododendron simsii]|uniref:Aminotransferase-like plant mobile domain-containing protein n=1 Tax=Rhododendron simsii TaxID=118357 RepID=A0A834LXH0_RHOSS|nr:hypothetical protein RHSIM_Rhsim01G0166400 [Rhododendron simsii]
MVRDDMEQGSKAIMQTSIRSLPSDEWRRAPYVGGLSDSFWRKAEAFISEIEISEDPLSLVPEAPAHWSDWVESVLSNPDFVHTLRASRALEPIRLFTELSIHKNNTNINLMVSSWSKDTHTFMFPWGDSGPTLQDTAILMRLSTRGSVALDPSSLSPTDARLVDQLKRAYTKAGKYGCRFDREGHVWAPPKSVKTSWGFWLRYFFKDLPPPGTAPPAGLAPSLTDISEGDESQPRIMRWSGVSSTKSWGSVLMMPTHFSRDPTLSTLKMPFQPASFQKMTVSWISRPKGFSVVVLPRNDRETFFTVNGRLAWRRNLDSFINYVYGVPEIPTLSDVYHCDVSLRSPKARQLGWWAKKSYWTSSNTTPAASRGVTIAEPLSTVIPPRLTRVKAKEKMSSQQQGPPLKRLLKGAPTQAARTPRSEETPASGASVGSSLRHEGKEHTPSSKLKRRREDEEAREGGSDSSIDDTAPISQFFKLPRITQPNPGSMSVAAGKKVIVDLAEGASDGTDSDAEGGDGRNSEEVEDSDADSSKGGQSDEDGDGEDHSGDGNSNEDPGDGEEGNGAEDENDGDGNDNDGNGNGNGNGNGGEGRDGGGGDDENLGADTMHPVVEEDEEDDDTSGLIPRRRIPTEGFLSIPDINQLAPEAVTPPLPRRDAVKSAFDPFHRHVNVPPTGDLAKHFQAHDAAVALANLTSVEVFADLLDDSLISLGTPQVGYVASNFGEGSSSITGGSTLQQHAEAGTSHGQEVIEDDSDVYVVEPPVNNEEEVLSNEAFFGQFRLTRDETSFLSFVRDLFLYTFFKIHGLYSLTMGRMQLQCLHHFLLSIKDIRVYNELDAAKIMRENEKLWRHCEGANAALEEAQVALARARDVVVMAEAVVKECKLVYEFMAEEARLGDRLIDLADDMDEAFVGCLGLTVALGIVWSRREDDFGYTKAANDVFFDEVRDCRTSSSAQTHYLYPLRAYLSSD